MFLENLRVCVLWEKNSHVHHKVGKRTIHSLYLLVKEYKQPIKFLNIKTHWGKKVLFLTGKSGKMINFARSSQYLLSHCFFGFMYLFFWSIFYYCHYKFRQHTLGLKTCKSNKLSNTCAKIMRSKLQWISHII